MWYFQRIVWSSVDAKIFNFVERNVLVFRRIIVLCFVSLITAKAYISHMLDRVALNDAFPSPQSIPLDTFEKLQCRPCLRTWYDWDQSRHLWSTKESMVRYELCRPTHNLQKLTTTATNGSWCFWFNLCVLTSIPDSQHPYPGWEWYHPITFSSRPT